MAHSGTKLVVFTKSNLLQIRKGHYKKPNQATTTQGGLTGIGMQRKAIF